MAPSSLPVREPAAAAPRRPGLLRVSLLGLLTLAATLVGVPSAAVASEPVPAAAAANPYERGPAPTVSSIEATKGPFATASVTVPRSAVSGFGGGTIYYPTSTTAGTFGAIAIAPGYTGPQFTIAWYGPRIASQGFVVFTIDTLTLQDQPDSRGTQLLAALDYLTKTSSVKSRIDATRLGVMGHSMGGGGSLTAARTRPSLQAIIPLTPYSDTTNWSSVTVPTLIVGADNDTTAPVSTYAGPFYTSLPATGDKALLVLKNGTHYSPISANTTIAKYSISWLKRFIDNDTRYDQFLCPSPSGSTIAQYKSTCPYS